MSIEVLEGKTLASVIRAGNEVIFFTESDGTQWKMHHHQDCCEGVYIEDVCGDLQDLGTTVASVRMVAYKLRKQGLQLRDRRVGGNNRLTPERLAARAEEIAQANAEMSEKGAPWAS